MTKEICEKLKLFNSATKIFLGTNFLTSQSMFPQKIWRLLRQWLVYGKTIIEKMTIKILKKFENIGFYRHTMINHFSVSFTYTNLSHSLIQNPFNNIVLSKYTCHRLSACLRPYNDPTSLHTFFSLTGATNPFFYTIYVYFFLQFIIQEHNHNIHFVNLKIVHNNNHGKHMSGCYSRHVWISWYWRNHTLSFV